MLGLRYSEASVRTTGKQSVKFSAEKLRRKEQKKTSTSIDIFYLKKKKLFRSLKIQIYKISINWSTVVLTTLRSSSRVKQVARILPTWRSIKRSSQILKSVPLNYLSRSLSISWVTRDSPAAHLGHGLLISPVLDRLGTESVHASREIFRHSLQFHLRYINKLNCRCSEKFCPFFRLEPIRQQSNPAIKSREARKFRFGGEEHSNRTRRARSNLESGLWKLMHRWYIRVVALLLVKFTGGGEKNLRVSLWSSLSLSLSSRKRSSRLDTVCESAAQHKPRVKGA